MTVKGKTTHYSLLTTHFLEQKENSFYAKNRRAWRNWLSKNYAKETSVWLILYHKDSGTPGLTMEEAVEEALCFGWIDSKANKRDDESWYQHFSQRKPKSNWSAINRARVKKLTVAGLMKPPGQAMVDLAKKSGTWTALDKVEQTVIPPDLEKAFAKNKKAFTHFEAFAPSSKRIILGWIYSAKRPETRAKRIKETVSLAAKNVKAL